MKDNTIYMKEKENPPRKKEEYSTLKITVSISGEPKNENTSKSTSLKRPKPLVRKVEGPFNAEGKLVEEMIEGQEYIFKATEHDESMHSLIKHIWWAEQLDGGEIVDLDYEKHVNPFWDEETKNKGVQTWDKEVVCYKYKAKKAERIRVYAYVASPAEKVSIEVPVVSFPFCVDRYKVPGLNREGTNIAQDLTYGRGVVTKTIDTVYSKDEIDAFKEEYKKEGFNLDKHGVFANVNDNFIKAPIDDSFKYSEPNQNSDHFASFKHNIETELHAKKRQLADELNKESYPKAIYSKQRIYNAKAWLIKDWVYENSGEDVKDYHEGNLLFRDTSDENLFKAFEDWATAFYSYGEMQGNIKRMIAKFKHNGGGIYEDSVLTKDIANHKATIEYCANLEGFIAEKIKISKGKLSDIIETEIDLSYKDRGDRGKTTAKGANFAKPTFGSSLDTIKGETIALNDIWATEVHILGVEFDNDNYKIQYEVTLWDHFGLDITDIEKIPNTFPLAKEAFAAWFALQHLRGYKPFLTKMTFTKEMEGNISMGKVERNQK